jgi:hypothetical protein
MTLYPPLEVSARESAGVHYLNVHGRLTIGEPSEHLNDFTHQLVQQGARKVVDENIGRSRVLDSVASGIAHSGLALGGCSGGGGGAAGARTTTGVAGAG